MNLGVYSAKDCKAGIYNKPFYCRHEAEAIRMFAGAAQDKNTTINMYPGDFELFKIGDWSDFSGRFENLDTPEFVMNAITAKNLGQPITEGD